VFSLSATEVETVKSPIVLLNVSSWANSDRSSVIMLVNVLVGVFELAAFGIGAIVEKPPLSGIFCMGS